MVQKSRAVTHDDLAPSPGCMDLGSKTAAFLMLLTCFSGVVCFGLCIVAEATRSRMESVQDDDSGGSCVYNGSGKTPLTFAAVALGGLAAAMVIQHLYLLIAVSRAPPLLLVEWDSDTSPVKNLTCQATCFFVGTWVCFAVGEVLLLVGLSVESGHFTDWNTPKPNCLVLRPGIFSGAGVLSLLTAALAAGVYFTVLQAQKISRENDGIRRDIIETAVMYSSPERSPRPRVSSLSRENPLTELPSFRGAGEVSVNFRKFEN